MVISKVVVFLNRNGFWALILKIVDESLGRLNTFFYSPSLMFSGVVLGRRSRIYGISAVTFSGRFYAKGSLWMDAVFVFNRVSYSPKIIIGDGVDCSYGVHIACINRVEIGCGTLIGSNVLIVDHSHGDRSEFSSAVPPIQRELSSRLGITIGENCWIGDGVRILDGANIGDNVVIGANSVVLGSVPSNTVCVGAPARVVKASAREG